MADIEEQPNTAGNRAIYDRVARHYDAAMRPLERWFLTRLRERVFDSLPRQGRILELGAGTGRNFDFYPNGIAGIATDPSAEMLSIARQKSIGSVRLVQSCAENLPFEKHSFDAALATLVFCSVESPAQAFAELRRVVKPGGTVVLLEHVRPGGLLGPVFDLLSLVTTSLFADRFNRRTAEAAQAAGLEVTTNEKRMLGIINLIVCRV